MGRWIHLSVVSTVILIIACLLPIVANAGWSRDPAVNTAISTQAGADTNPAITDDDAGGAIIAWVGTSHDIYLQRIDVNGNLLWGVNGKALTSGGDNYYPQLASDGAGGAFVTWQVGSEGSGIYVQRIDPQGTELWTDGGEVILLNNEDLSGNHQHPQIASDGQNGAIIVWQDSRSAGTDEDTGYDIYAMRIDQDDFQLWPGNGLEVCLAEGDQKNPQLIGDGNGGAVISWQDGRSIGTEENTGYDIYAQKLTDESIDDQIVVTEQWEEYGEPVCSAAGNQEYPNLIAESNGGAIIAWQDGRSIGTAVDTGYDVYAQKVDGSGAPVWTAYPDGVSVYVGAESQLNPQMVSDNNGGAVIVWADRRNSSNYDIYAQRIASGGAVSWAAAGVPASTAANDQLHPKLTSAGSSDAIITWQDGRSIGSDADTGYDIYAQKILSGGTLPVVAPTVTTASISVITSTSATGGGNVTSDGGSAVTARGICWGTSPDPAIGPNCISAGSGTGSFTGVINGLTLNTPYHVRAYATNTIGTSYGSDIAFTTINKYGLNLTFAGNGSGTVSWGGTTCGSACTFLFDPNATAQLQAVPLPYYQFTSWSGACSGSSPACSVSMDRDSKSITATFTRDAANSVRIKLPNETRYASLNDAIRLDADGTAVIEAWGWEFTESPIFDRGAFTLKGGWNQPYNSQSGTTTIVGTLTVKSGSVTVENLAIK
jgi:hypothetical protein